MKKILKSILKSAKTRATLKQNGKTMGDLLCITPWDGLKKPSAGVRNKRCYYVAFLTAFLLTHSQDAYSVSVRLFNDDKTTYTLKYSYLDNDKSSDSRHGFFPMDMYNYVYHLHWENARGDVRTSNMIDAGLNGTTAKYYYTPADPDIPVDGVVPIGTTCEAVSAKNMLTDLHVYTTIDKDNEWAPIVCAYVNVMDPACGGTNTKYIDTSTGKYDKEMRPGRYTQINKCASQYNTRAITKYTCNILNTTSIYVSKSQISAISNTTTHEKGLEIISAMSNLKLKDVIGWGLYGAGFGDDPSQTTNRNDAVHVDTSNHWTFVPKLQARLATGGKDEKGHICNHIWLCSYDENFASATTLGDTKKTQLPLQLPVGTASFTLALDPTKTGTTDADFYAPATTTAISNTLTMPNMGLKTLYLDLAGNTLNLKGYPGDPIANSPAQYMVVEDLKVISTDGAWTAAEPSPTYPRIKGTLNLSYVDAKTLVLNNIQGEFSNTYIGSLDLTNCSITFSRESGTHSTETRTNLKIDPSTVYFASGDHVYDSVTVGNTNGDTGNVLMFNPVNASLHANTMELINDNALIIVDDGTPLASGTKSLISGNVTGNFKFIWKAALGADGKIDASTLTNLTDGTVGDSTYGFTVDQTTGSITLNVNNQGKAIASTDPINATILASIAKTNPSLGASLSGTLPLPPEVVANTNVEWAYSQMSAIQAARSITTQNNLSRSDIQGFARAVNQKTSLNQKFQTTVEQLSKAEPLGKTTNNSRLWFAPFMTTSTDSATNHDVMGHGIIMGVETKLNGITIGGLGGYSSSTNKSSVVAENNTGVQTGILGGYGAVDLWDDAKLDITYVGNFNSGKSTQVVTSPNDARIVALGTAKVRSYTHSVDALFTQNMKIDDSVTLRFSLGHSTVYDVRKPFTFNVTDALEQHYGTKNTVCEVYTGLGVKWNTTTEDVGTNFALTYEIGQEYKSAKSADVLTMGRIKRLYKGTQDKRRLTHYITFHSTIFNPKTRDWKLGFTYSGALSNNKVSNTFMLRYELSL